MSALKMASTVNQLSENEMEILKRAKELSNEVNRLNTSLIGSVNPLDTVAQNIEEMVVLLELRHSKYNYRMEKIKLLKNKFSKTFQ
jgi:DNA anti-recombination protein RmuC